MRAAVRQTTRVLHSNKLLMEGIVNMQKELKNTHQQGMLMVKDLQQNTGRHRVLVASLSRDIHWIKQKQHDRHRLNQANLLLHEKNNQLKDKLLAAETQAGSDKRGLEEQLQAVTGERDVAQQETQRIRSELHELQSGELLRVRNELEEQRATTKTQALKISNLAAQGEERERRIDLMLRATNFYKKR